jgi:glutamate-1-semialdehyde 2,1-aminomutase/spore coat polysaccharide biosynthesis protein SpsF
MRIVVIIQARMGSTRLPKKVLMDLAGKPVVQRVYERASRIKDADEVVITTTVARKDDVLAEFCRGHGYPVYRGSEQDVLDRYYRTARRHKGDAIVRITGDCPLIDPIEVDRVIDRFLGGGFDYVSNNQPPRLPVGLDASIGSFDAYERSWYEARLKSEREHVTQYIKKHPEIFRIASVKHTQDNSHHRWTLDEQEDYEFLSKVYEKLAEKGLFGHLEEVLAVLKDHPDLVRINSKYARYEGLERSLKDDEQIVFHVGSIKGESQINAKEPTESGALKLDPSPNWPLQREWRWPVMVRGSGSHVWDADGNEYLDYASVFGLAIVGYEDERVHAAIQEHGSKGTTPTPVNELRRDLSKKLIEIIPWAESVVFVQSGLEGVVGAMRAAQAFSGRDTVLWCVDQGEHEWLAGLPDCSVDIPGSNTDTPIIKIPFSDMRALEALFSVARDKVAAIIMQPLLAQMPEPGYLDAVRDLAQKNGALLIFNEVLTGFRLGLSGAQEFYGVVPDITVLGQALGNGLPISAIVGRKDVLSPFERDGSLSTAPDSDPHAVLAALKTIEVLEKEAVYEQFSKLGTMLMQGMEDAIVEINLEGCAKLIGKPCYFGLEFGDAGNVKGNSLMAVFQAEALRRGVLYSGFHRFSLAHSMADIQFTVSAYQYAFELVRQAIDEDSTDGLLIEDR